MLDQNGFYAGVRDGTVHHLLARYGFSASIHVKTGEIYDPNTGFVTSPATYFIFPCVAAYGGGYTGKRGGVTKDKEGNTLVRTLTKDVFLDASDLLINPSPDDVFEDETGAYWDIQNVTNYNPGGVTVLWRITVKK